MSQILRPCPFCGSREIDASFAAGKNSISAGCFSCGATGPDAEDRSEETAAKRWNYLFIDKSQPRTDVQMIEILARHKSFPRRLEAARKFRGLSQAKLAELTKIPASSISNFEAGKREPAFTSLVALVKALGISADYLLGV